MYAGEIIYLFIFIFFMWIIMINIIRIELQTELKRSNRYFYTLVIQILAYKDGKIIGKTCQNERCCINDKRKEYEIIADKYMGKLVRIEYDIIISGYFFLSIDNIIYNIKPID